MKRMTTTAIGVLLLLCSLGPSNALACIWPPPGPGCVAENSGCPLPAGYLCDTLGIRNCQGTVAGPPFGASPFAATGDTVDGIAGIVTALDTIPTGFSFYLQNNAVPDSGFRGIDVFTGGTNIGGAIGLAIGDSVVVYGKVAEFGGGTEILSRNNSFTTPNIVVRRVSSGNPVPAFHDGTANELNYLSTNPNAEKWEGSLVRIASTMRAVRHTGLGTNAAPNANFICVDNTLCPNGSLSCDSVIVQTADLAGVNAPPNGALISSLQGIFDQRSINGNTNYEILPRKGTDMITDQPPHVVDAYSVSPDTVRVTFDVQVTAASAQNTANYTFPSLTSVNSATLEPSLQAVDLAVTPAVSAGTTEQITVNNIVGHANGIAMVAAENREYVSGIVTIQSIQGPNPDSLLGTPCEDVANYLGKNNGGIGTTSPDNVVRVTYRGVCIGGVGNVFYLQSGTGPRSGVAVFAPTVPLVTGRQYLIASSLQEFPALALGLSETEMLGTVYMRNEGAASLPAAQTVPISAINAVPPNPVDKCSTPSGSNAEDYEGMLVNVTGVKVAYRTNQWGVPRAAGSNFHVTGPYPACGDTIPIVQAGQGTTFAPTDGQIVGVTGILHLNFGVTTIYPRTNADITVINSNAVNGNVPGRVFLSLAANPARNPRLEFGVPRDAEVDLRVFDVAGRQVALLESGRRTAGSYSSVWNGAMSSGARANTGLYFYRLKVGAETKTAQGVLLH